MVLKLPVKDVLERKVFPCMFFLIPSRKSPGQWLLDMFRSILDTYRKRNRGSTCVQVIFWGKRKGKKRAKKGGMTDKLNLSLVINPGKCSIQNEHQPEKLAAAGKCPKSFCRTRAHEWGNAA